MHCTSCGNAIAEGSDHCTSCAASSPLRLKIRSRFGMDFWLCLLLGWAGVHRLVRRQFFTGILMLLTFGGFAIVWPIDLIRILFGNWPKRKTIAQSQIDVPVADGDVVVLGAVDSRPIVSDAERAKSEELEREEFARWSTAQRDAAWNSHHEAFQAYVHRLESRFALAETAAEHASANGRTTAEITFLESLDKVAPKGPHLYLVVDEQFTDEQWDQLQALLGAGRMVTLVAEETWASNLHQVDLIIGTAPSRAVRWDNFGLSPVAVFEVLKALSHIDWRERHLLELRYLDELPEEVDLVTMGAELTVEDGRRIAIWSRTCRSVHLVLGTAPGDGAGQWLPSDLELIVCPQILEDEGRPVFPDFPHSALRLDWTPPRPAPRIPPVNSLEMFTGRDFAQAYDELKRHILLDMVYNYDEQLENAKSLAQGPHLLQAQSSALHRFDWERTQDEWTDEARELDRYLVAAIHDPQIPDQDLLALYLISHQLSYSISSATPD